MVSQIGHSNSSSYEESPDRLQELVKKASKERGQRPPVDISRSDLVEQHTHQLKLLTEGPLPIRNFVLPEPYPPARHGIHDASMRKVCNIQHAYPEC